MQSSRIRLLLVCTLSAACTFAVLYKWIADAPRVRGEYSAVASNSAQQSRRIYVGNIDNHTVLAKTHHLEAENATQPAAMLQQISQNLETGRACRNEERLQHLEHICTTQRQLGAQFGPIYSRFIVDDRRKLVYCSISKSGCTEVKAIMEVANTGDSSYLSIPGKVHNSGMRKANLRRVLKLEQKMTEDYTKVLVVRNPFQRALSAFHNLQVGQANLGPSASVYAAILKAFPDTSSTGRYRLDKLIFSQFIQVLTYENLTTPLVYNDRHFIPMTQACGLCKHEYDLFLRLETFNNDSKQLLNILNLPEDLLTSAKPVNEAKSNSHGSTNHNVFNVDIPEFQQLPLDLLKRFVNKYALDFKLLGYNIDSELTQSRCVYGNDKNNCC